jgi:hypothetical protein
MSPRFRMIMNRRRDGENLNGERGPVTYWVADSGDPTILTTWTKVGAGIKHFGKRRLGRSGLDKTVPCPDNVWDIDCTSLFSPEQTDIHSAYFEERRTLDLTRLFLRGVDRNLISSQWKQIEAS